MSQALSLFLPRFFIVELSETLRRIRRADILHIYLALQLKISVLKCNLKVLICVKFYDPLIFAFTSLMRTAITRLLVLHSARDISNLS
jgi:hypothetical protein